MADSRTHYMPFHRSDRYPRHLTIDWRRAKASTLKRYVDLYELNVRPELTAGEVAVAVAKCVCIWNYSYALNAISTLNTR